jgi:TRAP-type C4-dicarboxylate transport system substrate-binding protein
MEKGVVDGGVGWNAGAIYLMNWYDAIKHITTAPVSGIFVTVSINLDLFNRMPKDLQDIMVDEGDQFGNQVFQEFQQIMIAAYDECNKAGIEIYDLPESEMAKWREATQPVVDDFFSQLDPAVATTIKDAIAEANK